MFQVQVNIPMINNKKYSHLLGKWERHKEVVWLLVKRHQDPELTI